MAFPPSCFIIGAQKAGTTSLAFLLGEQSDICLSTPKEPRYFSKNYARGVKWYESCFKQPERKILLDASPDYSRGPTDLFVVEKSYDGAAFTDVPNRISSLNSESRLIYVLRNPVHRTYSSYWHNVRAGYDKTDFSTSIRNSDRYLVASDYLGQLSNFLQCFPLEQFHFILFEDFIKNPHGELKRCCEFLEIAYTPADDRTQTHSNASYQLNRWGELVKRTAGSSRNYKRFNQALKKVLPSSMQTGLKKLTTTAIPKISAADQKYLGAMFTPQNNQLEELTGLDLSAWKY